VHPCTGHTAQRGSRGIALLFLDHGTKSITPLPLFTPGKDPVPIVQEAGWAPGPVLTGSEHPALREFDPRTVQPVASRYTDYTARPTVVGIRAHVYYDFLITSFESRMLCAIFIPFIVVPGSYRQAPG